MWVALLLSISAIAYNNVVNRWGPFHGAAYVPLNLTFAAAMTFAAWATLRLSSTQLGFQAAWSSTWVPIILVNIFALAVFALAESRHARRIADRRITHLRTVRALTFYTLVRIPLGTAVAEEVVFRGVLFAAWRDAGAPIVVSAVLSSVAFGLWHVTPTSLGVRINDPHASRRKVSFAVIAGVLFTTIAGMGLIWLQVKGGGLVGPIVMHAGVNSVGALAAVTAGRRVEAGSRASN